MKHAMCKNCDCDDLCAMDRTAIVELDALWERVNVLGGCRPNVAGYDQGYVDGIGAALSAIEAAKDALRKTAVLSVFLGE